MPGSKAGTGHRVLLYSAVALLLSLAFSALAQVRPYIGYVYPAGGQQGTTFQIRLGGQGLDAVSAVRVTGTGVTAHIAQYYRRLNFEEMRLLNEQLRALRQETTSGAALAGLMAEETNQMSGASGNAVVATNDLQAAETRKQAARKLIEQIEQRTAEFVPNPASMALASLVLVEVTIAPDAEPGEREIRLVTQRGISNPLMFCVGQVPEFTRKPMSIARKQVLGKEADALRRRPAEEIEERVTLPCTLNGQIASGEANRYRFQARRGQHLVITTLARELVPFMADAVPGWFQPVLVLYDAQGREVAYGDDYRFNPDPTLLYAVAQDGQYVLEIHDSLFRGREDFVYRITMGELPFITNVFPLGAPAGTAYKPELKGWNIEGAELSAPATNAEPGTQSIVVTRRGVVSNRVPFARDTLPELVEHEPNDSAPSAQKVSLPVIINGRIGRPDDWDVYQFTGKSNEMVVAEVEARRLGSPLDSVLKLTDAAGTLLAFNDDHQDMTAGLNTHPADSYLMARLPADGTYYVYLGDTARQGGDEYGYRLRLSAPRPDFDLRVVPSSLALRAKSSATLTVYVQRKDGFAEPLKLGLKDPPPGFSAVPVTIAATQNVARLTVRTTLFETKEPVVLSVIGRATVDGQELVREAVPAEDRMQAFLWRHLLPAKDLVASVFDPMYQAPAKRIARARPRPAVPTNTLAVAVTTAGTNALAGTNTVAAASKPKFSKQQVAFRLRQLKILFEEGLLTDDFYNEKVAECEAEE